MPGHWMESLNQEGRPTRQINGSQGELLVALRLVQHGFTVSWPHSDVDGYDLIADSGEQISRVQVKTCDKAGKGGTWRINFSRGWKQKKRLSKDDCDFVACVMNYPGEPAIYIIPIENIKQFAAAFYPPGQHPRYPKKWKTCKHEESRDRFDLLR